ncbi:hypothetical protein WH47_00002, partial [Habropoda laboriosa]
ATCSVESIAAMQAELRLQQQEQQQQQQATSVSYQQGELFNHLKPEALIQVSALRLIRILGKI